MTEMVQWYTGSRDVNPNSSKEVLFFAGNPLPSNYLILF